MSPVIPGEREENGKRVTDAQTFIWGRTQDTDRDFAQRFRARRLRIVGINYDGGETWPREKSSFVI